MFRIVLFGRGGISCTMSELHGLLVISFSEARCEDLCLVCILYFAWHEVHLRIHVWFWERCQLSPLCFSALYLCHVCHFTVRIDQISEAITECLKWLNKSGFSDRSSLSTSSFLTTSNIVLFFLFSFFKLNDQKRNSRHTNLNSNTCGCTLSRTLSRERQGKAVAFRLQDTAAAAVWYKVSRSGQLILQWETKWQTAPC